MSLQFVFILFQGCQSTENDGPIIELPPEEVVEEDSAMGWIEGDSGLFDTGFNEPMQFTLDVTHSGTWTLSPVAGPYEVLTGELTISEIADGDLVTPWCEFNYALTGQVVEDDSCPTCKFIFDIEFYVLDYDEEPDDDDMDDDDMDNQPMQAQLVEECFTPDTPGHQEIRRLGFSHADQTIYFNYYNSGIWIPWYEASQNQNEVLFDWTNRVGFYGFPDDD